MISKPYALTGYNTHRPEDKEAMLAAIGAKSVEALFAAIPQNLRLSRPLDLPEAMPEWALEQQLSDLAAKNATTKTHASYLGCGAYEHYIPAVVDSVASRGEFLTSYTPYQPEISQGLLQALFEYQTALAAVTGLPVVNGSCYDGATALADAGWTACLIQGTGLDSTLLLSDGLWQQHVEVVQTYMAGREIPLARAALGKDGRTDLSALEKAFKDNKPAGFLFQTPNAVGALEDVAAIAKLCQQYGVTSVCSLNPLACGLVTPPGKLGVDVVVCDGQVLGIPLSAGGPSIGVFAIKKEYRRYVPGRLVGKVTDINGNLAYALVYEDREQHVAREKAVSNICSNQALNAIRAVTYLTCLGEAGFAKIAALNAQKSRYLLGKLTGVKGVERAFAAPFFNEFVITLPCPAKDVLGKLQAKGIFAGVDYSGKYGLQHALLVAATEVKSKAQMDAFAKALAEVLA